MMGDEDKRDEDKRDEDKGQLEIIRDPIIAFLIIRIKSNNNSSYINTIPITTDWNNFNEDNSICEDEEIIGVVPAPQHSYMISGLFPCKEVKYPDNGTFKPLGFEFEGAYCPDWKKELERRVKNDETDDDLGEDDGEPLLE